MNIYDFAGNETEWTLEHATSSSDGPCASRGGVCNDTGSNGPATERNFSGTTYSGSYNIGFRPALYVN